eukprot:jgi/Tetstr1/428580/TSEL_018573.t1
MRVSKVKFQGGQIIRSTYDMGLPEQHGMYNQHFNAFDIHNKLSIGPGTIGDAWKCEGPLLRFFLYTLSVIEIDAHHVYNHVSEEMKSCRQWKCDFADALIQHGRQLMSEASGVYQGLPTGRFRNSRVSVASSSAVAFDPSFSGTQDITFPHFVSNPIRESETLKKRRKPGPTRSALDGWKPK